MNVIKLEPADVLIVTVPTALPKAQADAIRAMMAEQFGAAQKILILDAGASLDVMRSAQPDPVDKVEPTAVASSEALVLEPHVWLYRSMLTTEQGIAPYGVDSVKKQYAVRIADLTEEQKAIPYVADQLRDVGIVTVMVDDIGEIETNDIVHAAHSYSPLQPGD